MILGLILLVIYALAQLYMLVIILSFILSWFSSPESNGFHRVVYQMSNWYMGLFRGKLVLLIFDVGAIIGISIYQGIVGMILQCALQLIF